MISSPITRYAESAANNNVIANAGTISLMVVWYFITAKYTAKEGVCHHSNALPQNYFFR